MPNIFLALLLLAFAARVIKSVSYYFSDDHIIPDLLMNIGFGCNLAIAPLLWFYLKAFLRNGYRFDWRRDLIHFAPAVVTLALSPFLTDYFWLNQYGYTISLLSMLAYLPFCVRLIVSHFAKLTSVQRIWVSSLVIGITAVWLGYFVNYIFGLVPYITGPVLFSILIYFLSFLGLRQSSLFTADTRYRRSAYTDSQIESCYTEAAQLLSTTQRFKDPALTLPKLAKELGVSPNCLSEAINKKNGCNFPDFINGYRIMAARAIMDKPGAEHQKIAAIAYEAGFNSLSVFNAAFRKFTGLTPSAYRKHILER